VVVGRDAFKQLFVSSLLLIFLVFYPTPVTICWAALPVLMFIQLVLVAAVAMLSSALVPFLPDLHFIIQTAVHLMFFASGIFYDIESVVNSEHRPYVYLNPMAGLIKNYRDILIYGKWPDWQYLGFVALFAVIFFYLSIKIITKFDHIYPKISQ